MTWVGESTPTKQHPSVLIRRRLAGIDEGDSLLCSADRSICCLCFQFLRDFLQFDTWGDCYVGGRWEKRILPKRSYSNEVGFKWVFHRYRSFQELADTAQSGCRICEEARRVSDPSSQGEVVFSSGEAIEFPGGLKIPEDSVWGTDLYIHSLQRLDSSSELIDQDRKYNAVVATHADAPLAISGQSLIPKLPYTGQSLGPQLPYPSCDSRSKECFEMLSTWLANCVTNHGKCHRPRLTLPTRLIHIRPGHGAADTITLINSASFHRSTNHVKYTALSYCWGQSHNYKTTKKNIGDHMQGIALRRLPAVLRDAVEITRRCGIDFLWVDAICIIQDHPNDWDMEAARMGDVYADAVFTISALPSADCEEAILGPRQLRAFPVGAIQDIESVSSRRKLWIRTAIDRLPNAFMTQPLSQRAWCYQERLLSAGVVHYGHNQLIWECNSSHLETETGLSKYLPAYQTMSRLSDVGLHKSEQKLWDSLVVNFTQLDITYASDRVAAVSGLAAHFRKTRQFQGRYAAGLWESDLVYQLLWTVNHWEEQRRVGTVELCSNFPTWSWASVNRGINPPGWRNDTETALEGRPRFRLAESSEELQSMGIGKTLDWCEIILEGYMQEWTTSTTDVDGIPLKLTRECPPVPSGFWIWDRQPFSTTRQLYCLRMVQRNIARSSAIVYLVLDRSSEHTPNQGQDMSELVDVRCYKRIGLLTITKLSAEHFCHPWPNVCSADSLPLLARGRWEDIILI